MVKNSGKGKRDRGVPAPTAFKDADLQAPPPIFTCSTSVYLSLSQTEAAVIPGCYSSRGKPRAECTPGGGVRG
eukprot:6190840-Pleurochrysis_carterae.AAC.7